MEFDKKEKLAIITLLEKVAKADDQIVEAEMQVLLNAVKYLNANEDLIHESKGMTPHEAGEIIKSMNDDKHQFINSTVLTLMAADGDIDVTEVKTLLEIIYGTEEG